MPTHDVKLIVLLYIFISGGKCIFTVGANENVLFSV